MSTSGDTHVRSLRTGKPLAPPASRLVPVYPVRIDDGCVYVDVVPRSEG